MILIHKTKLTLHKTAVSNFYRTVIKTKHGRTIYLEVRQTGAVITIQDCYYVDRIRGGKYYAVPQKLITKRCSYNDLLSIIATELDRIYYGIEITDTFSDLPTDEFIQIKLAEYKHSYKFLIFVGEGETVNGIPLVLKTRFKNRIHRSIYIELRYGGRGKGVISDCHYYDRTYKTRNSVIPESLVSVFFDYNRTAIMNMINNELNSDFTDIIFVTDNSIDISNTLPLCGNV